MAAVRGGLKTLIAVCVALLLAVGLVACGGGNSSTSTSTRADSQGQANAPDTTQGSDESKSDSGGSSDSSSAPAASDFTPKHHSDSGGGSTQYRVKGGDNSIQEFGDEAGSSELDAAATALHNFLDARAQGNWAAACSYMSKSVIKSFAQLASQAKGSQDTSCAGILEILINPAAKGAMKAEAEQANVGSLRIEGEQAFVIYTGADGTALAMPMANEGGDWKVASLAGTPLA